LRIARTIAELALDYSQRIGFVPTMGAFHEGHLVLMREAKAHNDVVVASLFVNPTQFAGGEDFDTYPRDESRDFGLAESVGVDVMFAPGVDEIYPRNTTTVVPRGAAIKWEGERRPGHFEGVATVVLKLFNIVRPNTAYFGLKDFQQCAVLRQMVADLNIPVHLEFLETVREADGLAMSSRNVYLSAEERKVAPLLYRELESVGDAARRGDSIEEALAFSCERLVAAGFRIDYLEVVDANSLEPTRRFSAPARVVGAVWLGRTRLIDNLAV
jgi:pantoate--beta-alanine ligase